MFILSYLFITNALQKSSAIKASKQSTEIIFLHKQTQGTTQLDMANNTNYKPNEGKREEFRRYLEKTGVMDALTKVLVLLYEEADKPDDALKFILNALASQTGSETIDDLKQQITELQERIAQLETQGGRSDTASRTAVAGRTSGAVPASSTTGAEHPASVQIEGADDAHEKIVPPAETVDEPAA